MTQIETCSVKLAPCFGIHVKYNLYSSDFGCYIHALEFDVPQRLFPNFRFNQLPQGTLALVKTRTVHMTYMQR